MYIYTYTCRDSHSVYTVGEDDLVGHAYRASRV